MPALRNGRRERFCLEFVRSFNGAKAAVSAGYSPRTAKEQACRLLTNVHVKQRVQELRDEAFRKQHLSEAELLAGIAATARADVRRLFDENGELLPIHLLDTATAVAVASIDVVEERVQAKAGDDEGLLKTRTKRIRFNDRGRAQELLARNLNLFEREVTTGADAAVEAFARVLAQTIAGRNGIAGMIMSVAARPPAADGKNGHC